MVKVANGEYLLVVARYRSVTDGGINCNYCNTIHIPTRDPSAVSALAPTLHQPPPARSASRLFVYRGIRKTYGGKDEILANICILQYSA